MAIQTPNHIEEVSPSDMGILTQLLSLAPGQKPNRIWLQGQAKDLSEVPPSLLKPSAIIPRLAMALLTSDKARLCKSHKMLNVYVIRDLFFEISSEILARQKTLEHNTNLSDSLQGYLIRIHSIASLWMAPSVFRSTYPPTSSVQPQGRIESGCEACILAAIGGNHTMLSDLRASILGRKKKDHPQAPVLPFIESWIEWTGRGDAIRAESDLVMIEIRKCRRQMQKARRQISGYVEEGAETESATLLNPSEDEGDEEGHKIKEAIINLYADRESDVVFKDEKDDLAEKVHPALQDSLFFNEATGTFECGVPEPLQPRKYSASVYGQEIYCSVSVSNGRDDDPENGHEQATARAQAYRRLMGEDEDDGSCRRRGSRMTSWADFQ